jgi:peptide/nickel transport system permease protein
MVRLLAQRLLLSLFVLALVSVIVFVMVELLPGDAATAYLGRIKTPERVAQLRSELGLDRPAPVRYFEWAGNALRGDLGMSLSQKQPVHDIVWVRLRNSLLLGFGASLVGLPLAMLMGIIAGLYRDHMPDLVLSTVSLAGMSLPEFVVGTLLIFVFSIKLTLFPAVTIVDAAAPIGELLPYLFLPIVTLTIGMVGYILRNMRTSIIDVLESDYVRMARLNGTPAYRVVLLHALPNALLPTINLSAMTIAYLIGNLVVIEAVFNYPGIGTLALIAINKRDLPLLQAIILLLAALYVLLNLLADVLTLLINPRLRSLSEQ